MTFDKFKPHIILEKALSFKFNPNKFELWSKGQLISNGSIDAKIECIPVFFDPKKSEVKSYGLPTVLNIRDTLIFDLTFTSTDRIFMATVPKKTNIENYDSFKGFKENVPLDFPIITRDERTFEENEPYVCSIFLTNKIVSKISLSFGNNPRLLELFYVPQTDTKPKKIEIGESLIELLIEDWDDDGAWVGESNVITEVQNKYGYSPTKEEMINALENINSKFGKIIIREINDMGFSSSMVYKTSKSKSFLLTVLKDITG